MLRTAACVSALLLAMLGPVSARELRTDPISGKVRIIYIGDAIGVPNPLPALQGDPLLTCIAVYACTIHQTAKEIQKSVRTYMPRTYSRFLNNDVVILSDANRAAFKTDHFRWMKDGVLEEGLGLVMIGGAESFADPSWPSWKPTEVADVLPCEMVEAVPRSSGGTVRILDWDDEFIKSLPFKNLGPYGVFSGHNMIEPRQTAKLIASLAHVGVGESPFLLWWDIGEGRTMAQSADWTPAGGSTFRRWSYYSDYAINMMLFLAGQPLPDDIEAMYLVRRRMRKANEDIATLLNMVDFVEKLGGNTRSLIEEIGGIQEEKSMAMRYYTECNLEEAARAFALVGESCEDAAEKALRARDAAAFWIFLIEWAVVTATSLLAGSILWVIMVRRSLYREIETTRLIEA